MKMLTILTILLLAAPYMEGACADETAEREKHLREMSEDEKKTSEIAGGLDEVELLDMEEKIIESQEKLENVNVKIDEQLGKMEAAIASEAHVQGGYLTPLESVVLKFLKHHDRAFTENIPGKAQRIKNRNLKTDGKLAERAGKVLEDLALLEIEVIKYRSFMDEEGMLVLNDSLFESARKDKIDLTIVANNIKTAQDALDSIGRIIDNQFERMIGDVVSKTYNEDSYFKAFEGTLLDVLVFHDKEFTPAVEEKLTMIIDRAVDSGEAVLGKGADKALVGIRRLAIDIEKYMPYWNKEEGSVVLTTDIFRSRAESLVSKILDKPKFLEDVINLEENRLEFFLAGAAEKMWPKIREGKKPFCVSTFKIVLRDALTMIRDGKTYDVEKDLRAASERFEKKDEIKLLYAYVLLINWENTKTLKKGYKFLNDAYANLETEKLAYNLVRVGLRLGELQNERLQKIIAHVQHKGDVKVLGELNDIRICMHIEKEEYDEAYSYFVDELRERQRGVWKHVSPVLKFIVLLKQGDYKMIATDVAPYDTNNQVKKLL